ncbi:MAG: adenosylmethionine--8-amino-7-oxononanoate transaminase [Opitutales bacterium]|nr:adenosylmethionine--8-amino-7-oxononanoate transaminase [Opitutales bacterium]
MSIDELLSFDASHIWHPYTSALNPLRVYPVESAKGARIKLMGGQELIDGMSSWWAVVHGYNNPKINAAVEAQLKKMSHVMFGGLTHEGAVVLAKKLLDIVPDRLQHIFYCDSGSVAVEFAMKMALQYWNSKGIASKVKFATIRQGYHGDTFDAMSVCDPITGMHKIFEGVLPKQIFISAPRTAFDGVWDDSDLDELRKTLSERKDEIAAFILEPIVQGAGAMRFYHPNFLKGAREICDELGILLICDEIATGFGRTGKLFAVEWAGISPDIMCVGKAITGGYLSFAATLSSRDVAETISKGEAGVFMHGPTFMGNPLACAAAIASLDLVLEDSYLQNVKRIEGILKKNLYVARNFKQVRDVRVLGAIGVLEMEEPVDVESIQAIFVSRGVWIRPFGRLVYLMPPIVISDAELQKLCDVLIETIAEVQIDE